MIQTFHMHNSCMYFQVSCCVVLSVLIEPPYGGQVAIPAMMNSQIQWNLSKMVTVLGSHLSKTASLPGSK